MFRQMSGNNSGRISSDREDRTEKAGANILYDGFHDFIHVRVRGHLPGDKRKMLAKLNGIVQEYEGKEPVYSFVQGECPNLEYCDDGKAVWDMDRKTS